MSVDYKVSVAIPNFTCMLGEGPHWEDDTATLMFVDILGKKVFRYDTKAQSISSAEFSGTVGAVVPCKTKGQYLVAVDSKIVQYDWNTKTETFIGDLEVNISTNRSNDGKCDPAGRFWIGTMERDANIYTTDRLGGLYTVETDRSIKTRAPNIGLANGLAWTSDHKKLYYIDSKAFNIVAYDYDIQTGNITNKRQIVPKNPYGVFDGMCIDTDGNLWVAIFGGSCIVKYDPTTGKELRRIMLPASNITSCCWGGENFDILYVTCDSSTLGPEKLAQEPLAGAVFQITGLGAKGLKADIFQG